MIPQKSLSARMRVDMRQVFIHRIIDLIDVHRVRALSPKHQRKALARVRARRFYRRTIQPELEGLIRDLRRPAA